MTADTADAFTERYAHDLATSLRAGETTSRELTAAHLARPEAAGHLVRREASQAAIGHALAPTPRR